MPKPILKNNNLTQIIEENIKLLRELDNEIELNFTTLNNNIILNSDSEQLSRVFFNLIKNSIESIEEKKQSNPNFKGKIDVELRENDAYISFVIKDNGVGFKVFQNKIKDILSPYFTTKKKGTGLGLSIVNKIINDHQGSLKFNSLDNGAEIKIRFNKQ
jgi:two-component system nitrogen regulation sensor histidine kinase NtrY